MIESINDVKNAVYRAKREIFRVDEFVRDMSELVAGKLRSSGVRTSILSKLKKELKDYNIHTGRWKK